MSLLDPLAELLVADPLDRCEQFLPGPFATVGFRQQLIPIDGSPEDLT
ncbi:hypothetical protein ACRJ4W_07930 [Streptomyces sp. GLT-R25]